jgi:hypothetical protein
MTKTQWLQQRRRMLEVALQKMAAADVYSKGSIHGGGG